MKKIFIYIQSHFLLRNTLLAICFILIFVYICNTLLGVFTRHGEKQIVPSFMGMTLSQAQELATDGQMNLIVVDSLYVPKQIPGTVLDQSPKPDMGVKSGRKIFVTINSFRPKMEEIPYVTGFSLRQAKNKLESKGFEIEQLIYQNDMATNNVIAQRWGNKTITDGSKIKAELGSGITLVVGRESDAPMPMVPKVVGLTLREAKSRLWEIGLNIGQIKYDSGISPMEYDDARIYKQTPGQEARNDYGSRISVWLSTNNDKISKASRDADTQARSEAEIEEVADDESEAKLLKELGIEN